MVHDMKAQVQIDDSSPALGGEGWVRELTMGTDATSLGNARGRSFQFSKLPTY